MSALAFCQSHHPQDVLNAAKLAPKGQGVYRHFCANCHAKKPLIQLGAPRFRQKNDWHDRLAQKEETLFKHLLEGINAMPARGGCFECSDKELKEALIYMLPKKGKKPL